MNNTSMDSMNSAVGCEGQATLPERTRCEVWTRVMGYHRPVAYFNIGKKSEHYSRKHFEACVDGNSAFAAQYAPAAAALC